MDRSLDDVIQERQVGLSLLPVAAVLFRAYSGLTLHVDFRNGVATIATITTTIAATETEIVVHLVTALERSVTRILMN